MLNDIGPHLLIWLALWGLGLLIFWLFIYSAVRAGTRAALRGHAEEERRRRQI